MRLVDMFWMIAPVSTPGEFGLHWLDLAAPVGIGGLWLAVYIRQLGSRALLPVHDPYFEESLGHGRH
jgi:hypothetical protein